MANLCSFSMKINGEKEKIKTFLEWMEQKGTTYMGRGAEITSPDMDEFDEVVEEISENRFSIVIGGWCKWSVEAAMILNAVSMRETPERWSFDGDHDKNLTFITLFEACEKLSLEMEVYSEESGCCFQEHMLFRNGVVEVNDTVNWTEDYDDETDEWVCEGGFESWDFVI